MFWFEKYAEVVPRVVCISYIGMHTYVWVCVACEFYFANRRVDRKCTAGTYADKTNNICSIAGMNIQKTWSTRSPVDPLPPPPLTPNPTTPHPVSLADRLSDNDGALRGCLLGVCKSACVCVNISVCSITIPTLLVHCRIASSVLNVLCIMLARVNVCQA